MLVNGIVCVRSNYLWSKIFILFGKDESIPRVKEIGVRISTRSTTYTKMTAANLLTVIFQRGLV